MQTKRCTRLAAFFVSYGATALSGACNANETIHEVGYVLRCRTVLLLCLVLCNANKTMHEVAVLVMHIIDLFE